jgi:hypothetical protein
MFIAAIVGFAVLAHCTHEIVTRRRALNHPLWFAKVITGIALVVSYIVRVDRSSNEIVPVLIIGYSTMLYIVYTVTFAVLFHQ